MPAFFRHLSEVLYQVLECVGVNPWVVERRRHTYLHREAAYDVHFHLEGNDRTLFHFGSQSEGTTTPGLQSDTDLLFTLNEVNIMFSWADWQQGKANFLMVRDEDTPPQHYLLQWIWPDVPKPATHTNNPDFFTDSQGRVFYSNMAIVRRMAAYFRDNNMPHLRHGPSNSPREDRDFVFAFYCKKIPHEIISWFTKMQHGFWPSQEILQAARMCGCFLVPDGCHGSPNEEIQWRITPNLIERLLMFSLNMVPIKCLVVLKMLKKQEFVKYIHCENCKLTTFHCKTALFFTLNRTPPTIWKKCRLIECIVRCLQTILEFLNQGECPHFIVEGVDLFDGKLCRECQLCLERAIQGMIHNDMHVLFHLQCDDLGQRLMALPHEVRPCPVNNVNAGICGKLARHVFGEYLNMVKYVCQRLCNSEEADVCTHLNNEINLLECLEMNASTTQYDKNCIRFIVKSLMSVKASVTSSSCIESGQPLSQDIWQMYGESLNTDVASSKLKLASMHYCQGELRRAASVLSEVECDLDDSVQPVCGCKRVSSYKPSKAFCEYTVHNYSHEQLTKKLAFCVRFLREEKFCAPLFLWCEMYRAVGDDLDHRNYGERQWMDWAEVDAQPFLLYLQYLTYRGLRVRQRQLEAFHGLEGIVNSRDKMYQLYHPETVINLFGHCCELEGYLQMALYAYTVSSRSNPRNNAANQHKQRLELFMNNYN